MPIKDIMHTYECKYCKKKFVMFDKPNGELLYFPENVMWPVHGDLELMAHLRSQHRHYYDLDSMFYGLDTNTLIDLNYNISPRVTS